MVVYVVDGVSNLVIYNLSVDYGEGFVLGGVDFVGYDG